MTPGPSWPPGRPVAGAPMLANARLALAFIGFGLLALSVAAGTLVASPRVLLLPYAHPSVVALAHLWLPGFLVSVSLGAIYQLLPVVLGTPLVGGGRWAWTHLGCQVAGVPLLVGGFVVGRFDVVAVGGALVTAGVGLIAAATWRTFLASRRRDAIAWSFPLAVTWLSAAVGFGLGLAVNRRVPFLPLAVLDLLQAHAHVGLAGYFLTLLQGATFQLVPMFTLADPGGERWVAAGLGLGQVGLLVLAPGLAGGLHGGIQLGALLVVAGIGGSGVALRSTLRTRRRMVLEPGLKAFGLGAVVLGGAALGGCSLTALPAGLGPPPGAGTAYGIVVVAGALSLMIMGMLCKIVPFLVWMQTYGPRAGRHPVPSAGALGHRTLELSWLWLHGLALGLLLAGGIATAPALIDGGTWLLAVAVVAFLVNQVRVWRHLFRPHRTDSAPPRPAVSTS